MTKNTINGDDVRMVAARLGLKPEDVEDIRQALEDIDAIGFPAFVDQTFLEAEIAVKAAWAGVPPSEDIVGRTRVRGRIAEGLTEMLALRQLLPRH